MKIYVKFNDHSDVTINDVSETTTKDNWFVCLDADGDRMFVCYEYNIKYVEFTYDEV